MEDESQTTHNGRRAFLKHTGIGAVSVGLTGHLGFARRQAATLNILGWTAYDKYQEAIENELDVKLNVTRSADSAEMFSAWNGGQYEDFDIVVPNNTFVPKFIEADLLAPINQDAVAHYGDLFEQFQTWAQEQGTDEEGTLYAVPIRYGWYAYVYDSRKLPEGHQQTYEVLFSESWEGVDLKGDIVMDDAHVKPISLTGLLLGYEDAFKDTEIDFTEEQLSNIQQKLIEQKPLLDGYIAAQAPYRKAFRQGTVTVGQAGRYLSARLQDQGLDWVKLAQPSEGELAWFECGLVSKASQQKELAWQVVDQYISPDFGVTFAVENQIPSCSKQATQNLPEEAKESIGFTPDRLEGMYSLKTPSDTDAWLEAWEAVKAA